MPPGNVSFCLLAVKDTRLGKGFGEKNRHGVQSKTMEKCMRKAIKKLRTCILTLKKQIKMNK